MKRLALILLLCGCGTTKPWGRVKQLDHDVEVMAGVTTEKGNRFGIVWKTAIRDRQQDPNYIDSGTFGFVFEIGAK